METVILDEPGHFTYRETAPPKQPPPGQVLVRVHRIGVCGTDIHAFAGNQPFFTYPRILGHELGVEVVALGEGAAGVQVGERCAVEPYLSCGHCIACRRGRTNCCVTLQCLGVHTDGGMREFITVPAAKLHPSASLSYDQLALVEMLGIGAHAVERSRIEAGEWTLVIGAGPIGLSVIQFASVAGANLIVLDMDENRLDFVRQRFNVAHTLRPHDGIHDEIRAITNGDMPTAVFDATGSRQSMNGAIRFVANGGRLIFVGLMQGDVTFHDPDMHRLEISILASRNATARNFRHILALAESGTIDTRPWITHRAPLADVVDQFPEWIKPASRTIKAMITIPAE
jgi:2-desacetyl-2-hydroxyethyl bacteriochlorophyllide A dehydrogenase